MTSPRPRGEVLVLGNEPDVDAPLKVGLDAAEAGTVVVHVAGEIDVWTAPGLREALFDLVRPGQREIVIDLADVSFMDSTGIATFALLARRVMEAGGGSITLKSPRRSVQKVLDVSGLSRIVHVA